MGLRPKRNQPVYRRGGQITKVVRTDKSHALVEGLFVLMEPTQFDPGFRHFGVFVRGSRKRVVLAKGYEDTVRIIDFDFDHFAVDTDGPRRAAKEAAQVAAETAWKKLKNLDQRDAMADAGDFLPVQKSAFDTGFVREFREVEVIKHKRRDMTITFQSAKMSPRELRLLNAIVAIATGADPSKCFIITDLDDSDASRQLKSLGLHNVMPRPRMVEVFTSLRELAKLAKMDTGGKTLLSIHQGLVELSRVSVSAVRLEDEGGKKRSIASGGSIPLITFTSHGRTVRISVNPYLSKAVLADRDARYSLLNLQDFCSIKGEASILLLRQLSGYIDFGKSNRISIKTLERYIYGSVIDASEAGGGRAALSRKKTIRKAIEQLAEIGWGAAMVGDGVWEFSRPWPEQNPQQLLDMDGIVAEGGQLLPPGDA